MNSRTLDPKSSTIPLGYTPFDFRQIISNLTTIPLYKFVRENLKKKGKEQSVASRTSLPAFNDIGGSFALPKVGS